MAVYLIEIVMIVALSPLARCRISVIKNRKEFKGNDVYLFLVFFMLGLVMALRAKSVGTDTFTYYIINQKIRNSYSFEDALKSSTLSSAPLYVLYSYVLSHMFDSNQMILMLNSLIICVGFYRFIKKTSTNYIYSSLLFMLLTLYFESMNGMRQFVAIALALNAFLFLKDDMKSIKGWLIYIGAVLIHTTAIAFLVAIAGMMFVKKTKNIDKIIATTIAICIGAAVGMKVIVNFVVRIAPQLAQYIDGKNNAQFFNNNGSGRVIVLYLVLLFILIFISKCIKNQQQLKNTVDYSFFPSLYFCTIWGIAFAKNVLICRVLWYFICLFIPFIPNMYKLVLKGNNKKIMYYGTLLVLWVYCMLHLVEDKSGIIPYITFWSYNG